ncbi:hypothetical protein A3K29_04520 [Candidatus Collierbacteria bacterium RIFOXYB2_FULL_46_14]|uniref:Prolipoprotein diacylglyceryl transferase n=1 Tax=Candidatus Collierbacteria bacterium GW2011_GWA2_46_26 TaxID=1618381 RepID=A0A0G1PKF7_9BACT|nr:MAG: Prolipoprotein diacylglyceryl transferase [Candidatus Collierbacteria bacterium GW2011_GWC2_44_13]KKU33157.1 MAG: Prolipoprotein diacylglyceryl transferase [Candidatus Collierbacteria bacterium GW2011_GWA2_46_26]OGD73364.1 MAG: hypothetical protein A3K29_04520 [Candidatus Collierbacteria bacterium RIFOXYB2_FULL_46_14]OGD76406.1 MAG: hypothetical protein A3K43_04520 [Candidatus Collierbacteria bacterium RIFOXYA2_FULL_46_20]OGD77742.1 MAG: hypothetical protein A3K39_04520 [Candidatus Coll
MNDAIYRIGDIAIYGFGLLATLSFLWGSFVFYKKAVESHLEEFHILDGVVMSAFWAFIVGRLTFVILNLPTFWGHFSRVFLFSNYPGIDRWGVMAGVYLGVFLTVRRYKAKAMDWFDFVSLGILSGVAIFHAGLSLLTYSWQYGVLGVIYLVIFGVGWDAELKYRTYSWYKSNKTSAKSGLITGFSLSAGGVLYLVERLMFRGFDLTVCLWSTFLFVGGMVLVYIRSGRTASEDIKIILKHGRK